MIQCCIAMLKIAPKRNEPQNVTVKEVFEKLKLFSTLWNIVQSRNFIALYRIETGATRVKINGKKEV